MLSGARVLIAEDDALIGMVLADAVADAAGSPVGPMVTVEAALRAFAEHPIAAAILDVQLSDGDVTPLAMMLFTQGVPVVFHTGSAIPAEVVSRFGDVTICPKPMPPHLVVHRLVSLIRAR